jgi:hypothetical protein
MEGLDVLSNPDDDEDLHGVLRAIELFWAGKRDHFYDREPYGSWMVNAEPLPLWQLSELDNEDEGSLADCPPSTWNMATVLEKFPIVSDLCWKLFISFSAANGTCAALLSHGKVFVLLWSFCAESESTPTRF